MTVPMRAYNSRRRVSASVGDFRCELYAPTLREASSLPQAKARDTSPPHSKVRSALPCRRTVNAPLPNRRLVQVGQGLSGSDVKLTVMLHPNQTLRKDMTG